MPPESVDDVTKCPSCGYKIRNRDKMYVTSHDVWHIICYDCGKEFVE